MREPANTYDRWAVRVNNLSGHQVGHLSRDVVAVLSPLIDQGKITIEGTITRQKGAFQAPMDVTVLGDPTQQEEISNHLKRAGINLILAKQQTQPSPEWKELLDKSARISFARAQSAFQSLGRLEKDLAALPASEQPPSILTPLLPYQKQGLHWMMQREQPQLPSVEGKEMVQFWVARKRPGHAQSSSIVYHNIAANHTTEKPPSLARGGILADDMGLGKSLQTIALIAATKRELTTKPTLIVCPVSVIGHWVQQLQTHVRPQTLKVYVHHGSQRHEESEYLKKFDVVITTYQLISLGRPSTAGHSKTTKKKSKQSNSVLFEVYWQRIILDEGHLIKSWSSLQSKAVCELQTETAWILSGTPIQNKVDDLFALMRFLKITPFDEYEWWCRVFQRPLKRGDPEAMKKLQLLVQFTTLRRTKNMQLNGQPIFALPPIHYYLNKIPFDNSAEQELYNQFELESQTLFQQYLAADSVLQNYSHVLEVLMRMRQCCDHMSLVKRRPRSLQVDPSAPWSLRYEYLTKEEKEKILNVVGENMTEDCCICLDSLKQPVITRHCFHYFCRECVLRVLEFSYRCPMCRYPTERNELIDFPLEVELEEEGQEQPVSELTQPFKASSKIKALVEFLNATTERDSSIKSIVYSQWTGMLNLVSKALKLADIPFLRLDGKMSQKKREEHIQLFQNTHDHLVILCSLKSASLGINLTRASQVFLLDPWWNPSVEDQAVDRVYRLGQTRPVTVVRLAIEGTIEERVIDLQEEKRALAKDALMEATTDTNRIRETRLNDLKKLLLGK